MCRIIATGRLLRRRVRAAWPRSMRKSSWKDTPASNERPRQSRSVSMLQSTLLKLSQSKGFANWVISNAKTRSMARRFVAGEGLDEALAASKVCNDHGMMVSLDYLGENVSSTADAQHARDSYLEVFE